MQVELIQDQKTVGLLARPPEADRAESGFPQVFERVSRDRPPNPSRRDGDARTASREPDAVVDRNEDGVRSGKRAASATASAPDEEGNPTLVESLGPAAVVPFPERDVPAGSPFPAGEGGESPLAVVGTTPAILAGPNLPVTESASIPSRPNVEVGVVPVVHPTDGGPPSETLLSETSAVRAGEETRAAPPRTAGVPPPVTAVPPVPAVASPRAPGSAVSAPEAGFTVDGSVSAPTRGTVLTTTPSGYFEGQAAADHSSQDPTFFLLESGNPGEVAASRSGEHDPLLGEYPQPQHPSATGRVPVLASELRGADASISIDSSSAGTSNASSATGVAPVESASGGASTGSATTNPANTYVVRADTTDEPALSRRIHRLVRRAVRTGGGEVRIQLDPPRLGRVDVEIRLDREQLNVHFKVDNEEVRAAIAKNLGELEQALEAFGYQREGLTIDLRGGNEESRGKEEQSTRTTEATMSDEDPRGWLTEPEFLGAVVDLRV